MVTNNEEPDLAKTPMPIATPFTLAARSIASSKPANATRNRATRRGLQPPLDYESGPVGPIHLLDVLPLDQLGFGPTGSGMWTDWFRHVDRLVHYWARWW